MPFAALDSICRTANHVKVKMLCAYAPFHQLKDDIPTVQGYLTQAGAAYDRLGKGTYTALIREAITAKKSAG